MVKEDSEKSSSENEELYEVERIQVDPGQQLLRIDKFLSTRLPHVSRSKLQQAAKANCLEVNGKAVKPNYKVKPNDEIVLFLPYQREEFELLPENIPLDIVYEDEELLVINKPAGLVVHPGHGNYTGTLVNALAYHFENLPARGQDDRPGLVHRLDKNTSGLMVIAKTEFSMAHLAKQFFDRTTDRRYHALVWGEPEAEGTIEGHLGRSPKNRKLMTVFPDGDYGKAAITHFKMLQSFGYVSLVECKLQTGRTHQIRAHFKYIGHPLFGDPEYGGDRILKGTIYNKYKQFVENNLRILPRQALHAKTLGFTHPTKGEFMHFNSEWPEDLKDVLGNWENYAKHRAIE
ncbi:RluA family pseudouridine synthase [bacterium SCSIO 12741]|nr:RluA family pseudouridine synthase [bacterium SCSIO 12741]